MSGTPEAQITRAQHAQLIEQLRGTCEGLDNMLAVVLGVEDADYSLMPEWALLELDEAILTCEGCGWWVETSEVDDGLCADCY